MEKELISINVDNVPVFNSKRLNSYTNKIISISTRIRKNLYEIAFILSKIDKEKAYEDGDFKSTIEYAQKTFGFKKTMAYSLLKIGNEYTSPEMESVLPHEGKDFTVTQIEKLLPLKDRDKIIELVTNKEVTPDMSCRDISNIVKNVLNKQKVVNSDEEVVNIDKEVVSNTEELINNDELVYDANNKLNNIAIELSSIINDTFDEVKKSDLETAYNIICKYTILIV